MQSVEFETHIGGIPTIVIAYITPAEGDGWHNEYIPEHVADMEVLNMRGKPCAWRERRMTDADRQRIENEALEALREERSYV